MFYRLIEKLNNSEKHPYYYISPLVYSIGDACEQITITCMTIKNKSIIEFNIINPKLRPVSASADAKEVKNIKQVFVSQKHNIDLRILYDKTNSMEDKYLKEQFSIG